MSRLSKVPAIQYVVKPDFITVIIDGKVHNVRPEQVTFRDVRAAILKEDWNALPNLVSVAKKIEFISEGVIEVRGEQIFFKGRAVDNSITRRIVALMHQNEPFKHMVKFMNNVYANPQAYAQDELYDWLMNSDMPITDDGRFLAYKAVRQNYFDVHSGNFDNHPGCKPQMKREDVDPNRYNECSRGFHFCSLRYLRAFSGDRIMIIAVNPKDVVSIPKDYNYTKGRTWTYEVLKEYGAKDALEEKSYTDRAVEPIRSQRQEMLSQILAHPTIKRQIKRGKIRKSTIIKQTFARLNSMFSKLPNLVAPGEVIGNPLKAEREAIGYSLQQVADELDVSRSSVWSAEQSVTPKAETINNYRLALAAMQEQKIVPSNKKA